MFFAVTSSGTNTTKTHRAADHTFGSVFSVRRVRFTSLKGGEFSTGVVGKFQPALTDIVLGRSNKKISVWDDGLESNIEVDLLNYICISLRYEMWGEVPPPPDPENIIFDANLAIQTCGWFRVAHSFEHFLKDD